MDEPPVWIVRNGEKRLKMKNVVTRESLNWTGDGRKYPEKEIEYMKNLLESYHTIAQETLIDEGAVKLGRLRAIAIIEYLLFRKEIFEPIPGHFSLTAGGRI